jgi:hypothetical protein
MTKMSKLSSSERATGGEGKQPKNAYKQVLDNFRLVCSNTKFGLDHVRTALLRALIRVCLFYQKNKELVDDQTVNLQIRRTKRMLLKKLETKTQLSRGTLLELLENLQGINAAELDLLLSPVVKRSSCLVYDSAFACELFKHGLMFTLHSIVVDAVFDDLNQSRIEEFFGIEMIGGDSLVSLETLVNSGLFKGNARKFWNRL